MSVRTRSGQGQKGPVPKGRPPPPSFAPPTLPKVEQDFNVYIRKDKSSIDIQEVKSTEDKNKKSSPVTPVKHDIDVENVLAAPKAVIEQSNISETINVTLRPKKTSTINQSEKKNMKDISYRPQNIVKHVTKSPVVKLKNGIENTSPEEELPTEDDLAPEIRSKCNDVKEILNRIMNNNDDLEDEEPVEKKDVIETKTVDPFEKIDSIADLTLDQVREMLLKEEETNAKLKTELINKKDEELNKSKTQALKRGIPKQRKSKKELQLEKMKNFLKDPDKGEDQEVNLDIRLKKTGNDEDSFLKQVLLNDIISDSEKEEISEVISKIVDNIYFCSYKAVKELNLQRENITKVIIVSESQTKTDFEIACDHIQITSEDNISPDNLTNVAEKLNQEVVAGNKVLVTSQINTGVSACLCIPYLVKFRGMQVREAVQLIENMRPTLLLQPAVIVKIEEWAASISNMENKIKSITSLSQTWLPMIFFLLFMFMLLRTVFGCVGIDSGCVKNFLYKLISS